MYVMQMTPRTASALFSGATVCRMSCSASARKLLAVDASGPWPVTSLRDIGHRCWLFIHRWGITTEGGTVHIRTGRSRMNRQLSCNEMGAPIIKNELSVRRDVPSRRILELHDTAVQHSIQGYWNDVCCHRSQRATQQDAYEGFLASKCGARTFRSRSGERRESGGTLIPALRLRAPLKRGWEAAPQAGRPCLAEQHTACRGAGAQPALRLSASRFSTGLRRCSGMLQGRICSTAEGCSS